MTGALLFGALLAGFPLEREPCPRAFLPAYAHNDYENTRPLRDALALGFRGVEADVFLVDGALRLGHDRKNAGRGGSFEEVYLAPLRHLVVRCGRLAIDEKPFLLSVELKESSHAAFDSLAALLTRYADVASGGAVEFVLVGWHPPVVELERRGFAAAAVQASLGAPSAGSEVSKLVRMVSLDYGKTIGRWWRVSSARRRWYERIEAQKRAIPRLVIRAHNVPVDAAVYRRLLRAGVDLIGTKEIARSRRVLLALGA